MKLKINYNGEEYLLDYNKQSGYYECELNTEKTGITKIDITATDLLENVYKETKKIQILAVIEDKSRYNEKDICYILDNDTLETKDIKKLIDYKIDNDDETNANSTVVFAQQFNAADEDYILIKADNELYRGIFTEITQEKQQGDYQAKIKHISNIFDEDIFVENEQLIKERGIEDYIEYTIKKYFSDSNDSILNKEYIKVIVKTHTILQKSVDNEDGKYNFHTFITNCKQNYDIDMKYEFINKELVITIEKKSTNSFFVDCTVADIVDYKEIFEKKITAKVRVLCKDTGNIKEYCLNSRGNVKLREEVADEERVIGKTVSIVIEKEEEAFQNATDKFKGNDYNFLVEFSIREDSKLMNVKELKVGTSVKIKTKSNVIQNGYITARGKQKDSNIIELKAGKIRRKLTQKLKKGGSL